MCKRINACRICGNTNLVPVLDLGRQTLTGVFPKSKNEEITKGPLTLVKCEGDRACGLLQLAHSFSLEEMYGENYGYRSGLNSSMVSHLRRKVEKIKSLDLISRGDVIVDIGSNDATTLKQYELNEVEMVGIDPTGRKFEKYYPSNIELIPDFFSREKYQQRFGNRKAKIVTSFSMFYDLEEPISFMNEIEEILADDGIWIFEQSYMPLMLDTNSYDTVCHEHLEYYALAQIDWMAERVGLRIVDVEINDVNGGSFSVTAQKLSGRMKPTDAVKDMVEKESRRKLNELSTYSSFAKRAEQSKKELMGFLEGAKRSGKKVGALGASTKGNVLLQYCGIDESLIFGIGEINEDKYGSYTPGTNIPIMAESRILEEKPDYILVLPWHFRSYFQKQERYSGYKLVYPLPKLLIG